MSERTDFYHVRIEPRERRPDKMVDVEVDLTEEELRERFLKPYGQGEQTSINGSVVRIDQLSRLRITHSNVPAHKLRPVVNWREIWAGDPVVWEWRAAVKATDVTDDFLLGPPGYKRQPARESALEQIERLLGRFDIVVRQLRQRRGGRDPLVIHDEYDVQYLLHALLKALTDDVRAEEPTPSHAGGSSRVDFLLKEHQIVIEAKMTSPSLQDRQLGEQLLADIARYRSHPDCKTLICFVYDPGKHLANRAGLINDLSRAHDGMAVYVIIL